MSASGPPSALEEERGKGEALPLPSRIESTFLQATVVGLDTFSERGPRAVNHPPHSRPLSHT